MPAIGNMSQRNENQGWEHYFSSLPLGTIREIEAEAHTKKLASEDKRLFSGQGDIEVWHKDDGNIGTQNFFPEIPLLMCDKQANQSGILLVEQRMIVCIYFTDTTSKKDPMGTAQDTIYFIRQQTSWSALQASTGAVQQLLTTYFVSPIFLEALYSFGTKVTGDDDPHFTLLEERYNSSLKIHESCYILRTYERHGRAGLNNPWSLRQSLVYQRYECKTSRSVWIFVQLFQRCKDALWEVFNQTNRGHLTNPHGLFLDIILPDWRWYLDDQRQSLLEYTNKAMYSSQVKKLVDFQVDFVDCQRLEKLLENLSLSQEILKSIEWTIYVLQNSDDYTKLFTFHKLEQNPRDLHRTTKYINQVQGYIRTATALQYRAERMTILLTKLRDDRKVGALTHISEMAQSQRSHLNDILEETKADSRYMKILAIIATMHLPSNLLAALFSSNLVYIPSSVADSSAVILSVRKAMGIYLALSFFLTGLVFIASYVWNRVSAKADRFRRAQ